MSEMPEGQIIDDLLYVLDQGDEGTWSETDWCNWAAATSPDRIVTLMKMAGVNSAACLHKQRSYNDRDKSRMFEDGVSRMLRDSTN